MSKPKIGINGFGRIGRLAARIALRRGYELNAINDPYIEPDYMTYMFKFDSVHGRWPGSVHLKEGKLSIDGKSIFAINEKDPTKIKWNEMDVDIVIESSGAFTTLDRANQHIISGAKKVIITTPSTDAPMLVMGTNHLTYDTTMNVISNASCTSCCLATILKVLEDKFGVNEVLASTIHSYSSSQKVVDGCSPKDWRGGRHAFLNIVPSITRAAKSIMKIIPSLVGKVAVVAYRVPVADVSLIDVTVNLNLECTLDDIKEAMKNASQSQEMKGILGYTDEEVVSSDFITTTFSAVFDAKASVSLNKKSFKLLAWYDNEFGYSMRVVDMVQFIHEKGL